LRNQLKELGISISRLHNEMADTDDKVSAQAAELNKLKGIGMATYSLKECEDLERSLKCVLDQIAIRKV
jgi:hypothetical protein